MAKKDTQIQQFSMVEVSLVPDIKKELLRAQRVRNQVNMISIIIMASVLTLTLVIIMFIYVYQSQKLLSLDKESNRLIEQVSQIDGANQILTIQNQLGKLDQIHETKPISSRVFMLMVHIVDTNKLPITISGLIFNPHNNQVVIEGKTDQGYVALEKLQKIILDTKVQYQTEAEIDVNQDQKSDEDQNNQNDPKQYSITKHVPLLSSPGFSTEQGKMVLRFEIGFVMQEDFFKNLSNTKISLISPNKKDVTDSSLSVPENIFSKKVNQQFGDLDKGSIPDDKTSTDQSQNGSNSVSEQEGTNNG